MEELDKLPDFKPVNYFFQDRDARLFIAFTLFGCMWKCLDYAISFR